MVHIISQKLSPCDDEWVFIHYLDEVMWMTREHVIDSHHTWCVNECDDNHQQLSHYECEKHQSSSLDASHESLIEGVVKNPKVDLQIDSTSISSTSLNSLAWHMSRLLWPMSRWLMLDTSHDNYLIVVDRDGHVCDWRDMMSELRDDFRWCRWNHQWGLTTNRIICHQLSSTLYMRHVINTHSESIWWRSWWICWLCDERGMRQHHHVINTSHHVISQTVITS